MNPAEKKYERENLAQYFPKDCSWKIIEVKKTKLRATFSRNPVDTFQVFTSISYPNIETSPSQQSSTTMQTYYTPIKETVIEFNFIANNGLYLGNSKITDANVLWDLPMKIKNLKYEYEDINSNLAFFHVSFSLDWGNPKWFSSKEPFSYTFSINNENLEQFVNRYPNYSIKYLKKNNYQKITLTLDMNNSLIFEWPKDVAQPINLKVIAKDGCSPAKVATGEIKVGPPPASEESKDESPNARQESAKKPLDKSIDKL